MQDEDFNARFLYIVEDLRSQDPEFLRRHPLAPTMKPLAKGVSLVGLILVVACFAFAGYPLTVYILTGAVVLMTLPLLLHLAATTKAAFTSGAPNAVDKNSPEAKFPNL